MNLGPNHKTIDSLDFSALCDFFSFNQRAPFAFFVFRKKHLVARKP